MSFTFAFCSPGWLNDLPFVLNKRISGPLLTSVQRTFFLLLKKEKMRITFYPFYWFFRSSPIALFKREGKVRLVSNLWQIILKNKIYEIWFNFRFFPNEITAGWTFNANCCDYHWVIKNTPLIDYNFGQGRILTLLGGFLGFPVKNWYEIEISCAPPLAIPIADKV